MIHNTFLIHEATHEVLAHTQYWPIEVDIKDLEEFVATRADLKQSDASLQEIPLIIGDFKFHGWPVNSSLLLVFITDLQEDEYGIFERMNKAATSIKNKLKKGDLDNVISEYATIIEPSIITRLKIALVGEGGVGKTTTLHLLLGDTPPTQYVPTIALNLETVENIRFGNYSLVLWDFAGQERFRNLWKFYFHGADVIFLVCDSSLRNVLISKDILKLIRRDAPKVPVFALANKQDLPNAMKPGVVQKILGVPTYPMVAIDKERRDEMLRILMNAAAQYVGIALPDLPASELLRFSDEAAKAASEIEHLGSVPSEEASALEEKADEVMLEDVDIEIDDAETIEIIEEVLVDEDGHIIEDDEDYEIVEVIEEVVENENKGEEFEAAIPETSENADSAGTSEPEESSAEIPTDMVRTMAEAIISDRLDGAEDEVIESEIEQIPNQSLDEALKALGSDESPIDELVVSPSEVNEEELADLSKILGDLDEKINGLLEGTRKSKDDTLDADHPEDVDSETVDHIKRIIDSDTDE